MNDRYEIRGKLGQGGLGSVYRAWDGSLNREVAIKRIRTEEADDHQQEEATRQMTQETGALAALQHPNIVTIHDVGNDEDGPFVIMELLSGDTLDAIVEKAPLTFGDFRELAQQIQEGLIAAQDLGLVHRDLKPSNIMLTWLPSGKFQAKIVDFGLAKFSAKPSAQTLDQNESVYGSIFYMAPEQFERAELDARTDMYAIGCVYYFALTGRAPFEGETGPQVMAAHLEHRVVPLVELRPDLPKWVSDWVMWHLNRKPGERPENAREALGNFMELDNNGDQTPAAEAAAPKRPRLLIPGASSDPADHPPGEAAAPVRTARPIQPGASAGADTPRPSPTATQTAPQPLQPPEGAPPSIHTTSQQADAASAQAAPGATEPAASARQPVSPAAATPSPAGTASPGASASPGPARKLASKKKRLGNGAKAVIACVLAVVVLGLGFILMQLLSQRSNDARYNELVEMAAESDTSELPVNGRDLGILLRSVRAGSNTSRETVYKALSIAEATDGTDIDTRIAEFATEEPLPAEIRADLLGRVLLKRSNPVVLPYLLDVAKNTDDEQVAAAALTAMRELGGDEEIDDFLDVIQFTDSNAIRSAAERATAEALQRSGQKSRHAEAIATIAENAGDATTRRAMLRLLGYAGGEAARDTVLGALESDDETDRLAALNALRHWIDDSMFPRLIEFLRGQRDDRIRPKAFDAAYAFLMDEERQRPAEKTEEFWSMLADSARTSREKLAVIGGLVRTQPKPWALEIIETYANEADADEVIDRAEQAAGRIKDRMNLQDDE